ncbi:UNVERIFIED_CONTAM: hypothetical protein Slati_2215900 [Sesamum latifolium]|uniref:Uncharacterized protein n=1 Tax=Sesamum latifolium TaxID=2727402 RepID=A0AAW2WWQ0_9LAMI
MDEQDVVAEEERVEEGMGGVPKGSDGVEVDLGDPGRRILPWGGGGEESPSFFSRLGIL